MNLNTLINVRLDIFKKWLFDKYLRLFEQIFRSNLIRVKFCERIVVLFMFAEIRCPNRLYFIEKFRDYFAMF